MNNQERIRRNKLSTAVSNLYDGESVYYVYEHLDPNTREVRYVGHGVDGRAYEIFKPCARRCVEHAEWAVELAASGYLPSDYIRMRAFGISKKSAVRIERDILRKHKENGTSGRLFNKQFPKCS